MGFSLFLGLFSSQVMGIGLPGGEDEGGGKGGCLSPIVSNCQTNEPPSKPKGFSLPSTDIDGNFKLTWEPSSGWRAVLLNTPSGWYEIQESYNLSSFSTIGTLKTLNPVYQLSNKPNGIYQYRVKACDEYKDKDVCSDWGFSSEIEVRNKPSTPSKPSDKNSTSTSFSISWSKPSGTVTYYSVQEKVGSGSWSTIVSSQTGTSLSRSGKSNNSVYYYRVRACNTESWSCSSYSSQNTVRVELKPSTPSAPNNVNSTATDYTVNWSKPSGSVNFYQVQERESGGSWKDIATSHSSTSISRSGKSNNKDYEYRVRACNSYTWSCSGYSSANSVKVRLKPSTPSAPSRPSTSTGSAAVSWTKPSGTVTYYDVQKRKDNGSWSNAKTGDTNTSETLTGLTDGAWDFRVRACNGYSWSCSSYSSASSDTTVRLKPSAPSAPSRPSTSTGSASISWTKPSGTVTYYDLQKRKDNGSWSNAKTGDTGTSETITGLTDGAWDYRVRACNGYSWACSGYSSASSDTTVRLKPSTPSAPSRPSTSTGSAAVSWTKPSGTVTYYDIQKRKNNGSWANAKTGDTNTSETLTDLTDGLWDFRVRACNSASWSCSSYSSASSDTKVRLKPSTPSKPTLSNIGTGSHQVNWAKPSGTVTEYDVIEYKDSTSSYSTVANDTTGLSLSLSGKSDGDYTYRVRACNDESWACSAYSSHSSKVTVLNKPGTPSSISTPSQDVDGSITISWENGIGEVENYQLEQQTDNGTWYKVILTDNSKNSLTRSFLDGVHLFRVKACNEIGCSGFKTSGETEIRRKPATPSAPSVPSTSSGSANVSWSSQTHATYYDVQQRKGSGSWTNAKTGDTGTSETITDLTDGSYQFRVRACNSESWSCSNYSSASSDTKVRIAPSAPAKPTLNKTQSTDGAYKVSWTKPSGTVTLYDLQAREGSGSWSTVADNTTSLSKSFSGQDTGDYTYQVRACNEFSCSGYSSVSNSIAVRITPSAPSISKPTGSSDSDGEYTLEWNKPSETTYFNLQRRKNSGSWTNLTSGTSSTGTSYSESVTDNGTYDYRVNACNQATWSCSGYSSIKSVQVDIVPDHASKETVTIANATLNTLNVPDNEAVGALEGQAGVSGGAATYSIPIAIPPGRAGMQPSVSLNYSSRSGNGIAGVGWSLSAGSSIHRCGQTVAHDGKSYAVTYDADEDRLCLDGQRLISLNNDYGTSGSEYRTEIDSFTKIKQSGEINASSTFAVHYKNGNVSYYGGDNSSHSAQGRSETLTWALNYTVDQSGNRVDYHYSEYGDGEWLLDTIEYTKDGSNAGDRKVNFVYESSSRPDPSVAYLSGGKTESTKRLLQIETEYNNTLVRQYLLDYGDLSGATQRSLLRSVKECSFITGEEVCLEPTNFEWHDGEQTFELKKIDGHINPISKMLYKTVGDLNGDGIKESFTYEKQTLNQNELYRLFSLDADGSELWSYEFDDSELELAKRLWSGSYLDIDNDGITDIYQNESQNIVFYNVKINNQSVTLEHKFDSGIVRTNSVDEVIFNSGKFIDVDNDGLIDYIGNDISTTYKRADIKLWKNSGSSKEAYFSTGITKKSYSYSKSAEKVTMSHVSDINGDSLVDIFLKDTTCYANRYGVLVQNTSGNFIEESFESMGIVTENHPKYVYHQWVDINGDGLVDYLFVPKSGSKTWHYQLNKGGNFDSVVNTNSDVGFLTSTYYNETIKDNCEETVNSYTPKFYDFIEPTDLDSDGRIELTVPISHEPEFKVCVTKDKWLKQNNTTMSLYVKNDNPLIQDQPVPPFEVAQYIPADGDFEYCPNSGGTLDLYTHGLGSLDESIYQVKAYEFNYNSIANKFELIDEYNQSYLRKKGSFSVKTWQSDFYGDGLIDLNIGMHGNLENIDQPDDAFNQGIYYYHNKGASNGSSVSQSPDLLKKVKTGLQQINEWSYAPLTSQANRSANEPKLYDVKAPDDPERYVDDDHFYFTSSMYVVSDLKQSDGIGGVNETEYSYREAIYNRMGRGFQGFRSIIVDSPSGIRSVTDFHQKFPLAGQIESVRTCLVSDNDALCSNEPLSQMEITSDYKNTTNDKVFWVIPTQSVEETFDLTDRSKRLSKQTRSINLSDTDSFGNILKSSQTVDNGYSEVKTTTVNAFDNDEDIWWVNKLTQSQVTTQTLNNTSGVYDSSLDSTKALQTDYTWTAERKVDVMITSVTQGEGKTISVNTDYNSYGLPIKVTTASSGETDRVVETGYSDDGYFVEWIDSGLGKAYSEVNPNHGQPDSTTDINGLITQYQYDAFGRAEQITPPTGQPLYTRFAWCEGDCDGHGFNNSISDNIVYKQTSYQAGAPQSVMYKDKLNRTIATATEGFSENDWVYTTMSYDELGRQTKATHPSYNGSNTKGTHYQRYDVLGRLTEKAIDQAYNQQMEVAYSYHGHRTDIVATSTDKVLNMSRTYSSNGQLIQTTDADDSVTQYAYDAMGNPIVLSDPNGNAITAEYNGLGQKKYVSDPNMGTKTFSYTGFGEVHSETDANKDTYRYAYDTQGRLTERYLNDNLEASFTFDTASQGNSGYCIGLPSIETSENDNSFSRSYAYDGYCRPITTTTTIDEESFTNQTQYDDNYGRVKGTVYPTGITLESRYNDRGYLTEQRNGQSGYVYHQVTEVDARGQVLNALKADGILTESSEYDENSGQMLSVHTHATNGGTQRHRIDYVSYDGFGNLTSQQVETTQSDGSVLTTTETYAYDNLHRLTQSALEGNAINYAYDAAGNLTQKDDYASSFTYGNSTKSNRKAGPNAVYEITKVGGDTAYFDYDDNGNLLSGDGKTLTYNAFNKPVSISKNTITSRFYYGSDQMRYKQVKEGQSGGDETTLYIGKAYEEIRYDDKVIKKSYLGDSIITETEENNSTDYQIGFVHRDRLGSVVTITDETGQVIDNKSYDPFGKPRKANLEKVTPATLTNIASIENYLTTDNAIDLTTRRGFTDHEHLDDAELIHMNGRVYDYNLGRFLSVDPYVQFVGNSQGINPYSYIMNNPLAGTDPSGYVIDTVWDVASVVWDLGKIAVGGITGDDELVDEGLIDLAADSAAVLIPFVPAGTTKVARAVDETADAIADVRKAKKGKGAGDAPTQNKTPDKSGGNGNDPSMQSDGDRRRLAVKKK